MADDDLLLDKKNRAGGVPVPAAWETHDGAKEGPMGSGGDALVDEYVVPEGGMQAPGERYIRFSSRLLEHWLAIALSSRSGRVVIQKAGFLVRVRQRSDGSTYEEMTLLGEVGPEVESKGAIVLIGG